MFQSTPVTAGRQSGSGEEARAASLHSVAQIVQCGENGRGSKQLRCSRGMTESGVVPGFRRGLDGADGSEVGEVTLIGKG